MRRCASDAQKLEQLRRLIREIEYLKYTLNSTLYWDKMTYMPEKGLTYRSEVMSVSYTHLTLPTNSRV